MRRSQLPAWLLLPSLLLWTGCGPAPLVRVKQDVPAALLTCREAPAPPPVTADDAALALWIVDLAVAGDDCRARLGTVKELLSRAE